MAAVEEDKTNGELMVEKMFEDIKSDLLRRGLYMEKQELRSLPFEVRKTNLARLYHKEARKWENRNGLFPLLQLRRDPEYRHWKAEERYSAADAIDNLMRLIRKIREEKRKLEREPSPPPPYSEKAPEK